MRLDRVPALLSVVLVSVLGVVGCGGDDDERTTQPDTSPTEVNLGTGYQYREDTLARFRLLIEQEGWSLADPAKSAQGVLEAVHANTGVTFVLIPSGVFRWIEMTVPDQLVEDGPLLRSRRIAAFLLGRSLCTEKAWRRGGGRDSIRLGRLWGAADFVSVAQAWEEERDHWRKRNGLRIPSDLEWAFACRGGSGNRLSRTDSGANVPQVRVEVSERLGDMMLGFALAADLPPLTEPDGD